MGTGKGRRLPASMRQELSRPFGPLIDEKHLKQKDEDTVLITVGDVVSLTARRVGLTPSLSVYDGLTERREMTDFARLVEASGEGTVTVHNPAGTVTAELVDAVERSLNEGAPVNIRVVGEEDLAVLACIILAPHGAWIVYGQPGEGMVLVVKDSESLERSRALWDRMEEME